MTPWDLALQARETLDTRIGRSVQSSHGARVFAIQQNRSVRRQHGDEVTALGRWVSYPVELAWLEPALEELQAITFGKAAGLAS